MTYQFLNLGFCRLVGLIGYLIEGDPFLGCYFSEDFYLQRGSCIAGIIEDTQLFHRHAAAGHANLGQDSRIIHDAGKISMSCEIFILLEIHDPHSHNGNVFRRFNGCFGGIGAYGDN